MSRSILKLKSAQDFVLIDLGFVLIDLGFVLIDLDFVLIDLGFVLIDLDLVLIDRTGHSGHFWAYERRRGDSPTVRF